MRAREGIRRGGWGGVSFGMIAEDSSPEAAAAQYGDIARDWMNGNDGFLPATRLGHGGIAAVSRVTRIAASTIGRGLKELDAPPPPTPNRIRRLAGDASR